MISASPVVGATTTLASGEQAIARAVLFASVFDYPLTLSQVRRTLVESEQTATDIWTTWTRSTALRELLDYQDGFFFPRGRATLVAERRRREARSRAFLSRHSRLLRVIGALPYVDMVALSGSIAHLNLEGGGDLDLFIVTRGRHVWSVTVTVIVLARLMRRRRTLCANLVVADSALAVESGQDLFTASQIVHLRPLLGGSTYLRFLEANPFVRGFYRNVHGPEPGMPTLRQGLLLRTAKRVAERLLEWPAAVCERGCRRAYRGYLLKRSRSWPSPEQVRLDDDRLKLHTHSHRTRVLERFEETTRTAGV